MTREGIFSFSAICSTPAFFLLQTINAILTEDELRKMINDLLCVGPAPEAKMAMLV